MVTKPINGTANHKNSANSGVLKAEKQDVLDSN